MREVKYTTRFRRDYQREKSGRHSKKLDALLMEVVNRLAADTRRRHINCLRTILANETMQTIPSPQGLVALPSIASSLKSQVKTFGLLAIP
jgi:hypothetical protein